MTTINQIKLTKKNITYNEAVTAIEEILHQLENDELDVDEMANKVKRVSELISLCRKKLYKAEKEVENIIQEMDKTTDEG